MPIGDWDGTTYREVKPNNDWDGTTEYTIAKVHDWDGTTSHLIWTADQALFSSIKVREISTAKGNPYESDEAQTQKYGLNYSDWSNISLTGSYNFEINGLGEYTVSNKAELRGTINGQDTLIDTINNTDDNGSKIFNINKNISIAKYTGVGDLYLYIWLRNSNNVKTSGGRLSLNNMACILS